MLFIYKIDTVIDTIYNFRKRQHCVIMHETELKLYEKIEIVEISGFTVKWVIRFPLRPRHRKRG